MSNIIVKSFPPPPVDLNEVYRYMGVKETDESVNALVEECLKESQDQFNFKVCYFEADVSFTDDYIDLGFTKIKSRDLKTNLKGCNKAIVFGATIGIGIDKLIGKYTRISPSKAFALDSVGAQRIEALCDCFNDYIKNLYGEKGCSLKPRFSAGYGDLSLEVQKDFFKVLDCPRQIGLTLNDSLVMSPSKSVTAIIGIVNK